MRLINNNHSDTWALILGASSGFGAACSLFLAKAGFSILGVHLDRKGTMPKVEETIEKIRNEKVLVEFHNVNAADTENRVQILAHFREKHPQAKIQVLVHSLAFGTLKPFLGDKGGDSVSKSQMDMTLDVMANSLVYWVQNLVTRRLIDKGGRIFAMTSAGSDRVWRTYGAVSAAKAALESHTRQLSLELAPLGITVNALRAGVTDTPALRKIPGCEEMIVTAQKKNPSGRLTTPEDVANAMVVLCHPNTYWITGNVINIDGGEFITD